MISRPIGILIAAICLCAPAVADETAPDTAGGRYIFNKQPDGFVRLDTQTGEVALCSQRSVGWACEVAPEDRAVLENEIARLRSENGALKKDLLSSGLPLPPGVMPPPVARNDEPTLRLPDDADVDRLVGFADHVWRRFLDAVERAQQHVLNKS